jgi:uncharacterized membrane protein
MGSPAVDETASADAPAPQTPARRHRWYRRWFTYDFAGIVGALLFAFLAATPSLIPRGTLFQGLVAGAAAALGYAAGLGVRWVVVQFTSKTLSPAGWRRAWQILTVSGVVALLVAGYLNRYWQAEVRDLMGMSGSPGPAPLVAAIVMALFFVLIIAISRGLRRLNRWALRQLDRVLPIKIAKALAFVVVVFLALTFVNDVVVSRALSLLDSSFAQVNRESYPDTGKPTSDNVSGGLASTVTWASLGRTGRDYVAGTPTPGQITDYTSQPALSPVRAYVGLKESDDVRERALIAVNELKTLGGFERDVLIIGNTTGSGWVDDEAVWPLEFMYGGNTAAVAMQYSYLPSWISFLVDKSRAEASGRALFDAVYGEWVDLPETTRPKLVVFGESLGSFGGETAFSGADDMQNRTDGIVFMGPTFDNTLAQEFRGQRDAGSPQWQPIFQGGREVRFIAEANDFRKVPGPWDDPKIMYIQHASDPISWWSPNLLLSRPDWLAEDPGPDRSGNMFWIPLVTFFQVSADLAVANNVPDGHGHKFGLVSVDAWAEVLPPEGWTPDDTESLKRYLAENPPDPTS